MEPKWHILLEFGLVIAQPKMRAVSQLSVSLGSLLKALKAQRTATCTKLLWHFIPKTSSQPQLFLGRRAISSLCPSLFPSHTMCCTHVPCPLGMLMMFNHILGLVWLPTASGVSFSPDERKLHTKPPGS